MNVSIVAKPVTASGGTRVVPPYTRPKASKPSLHDESMGCSFVAKPVTASGGTGVVPPHTRPKASKPSLHWSLVLLTVLLAACGGPKKVDNAAPTVGFEKTFERGPVTVVVRIDKKEPTIADRIRLELEVTSDEDTKVTLPTLGAELSSFGIVDYTTSQPELTRDGKVRQTRAYVLEPFLSGKYEIPPFKFPFVREKEPEHLLETEAIPIEVKSLLPEDAKNLDIHDIAGPVNLPKKPGAGPGIVLVLVLLLVLAGSIAYYLRNHWRPRQKAEPPRPADEIAFEELQALIAEDLPGKGEIKAFYQRLSAILRRYIENRFTVHAPGQTTEEFLAWQSSHEGALERRHQILLAEFLRHCDLVKFAELQPSEADIQKTFDSCRDFILETREAKPEAEAGPNSNPQQPITSNKR